MAEFSCVHTEPLKFVDRLSTRVHLHLKLSQAVKVTVLSERGLGLTVVDEASLRGRMTFPQAKIYIYKYIFHSFV